MNGGARSATLPLPSDERLAALPVLPGEQIEAEVRRLAEAGARLLAGSMVDMAGVARVKTVPLERAAVFHRVGVGASPTWSVFCIDNAVAFTDRLGVVGDLRLRADLAAATALDSGYAWAPTEIFDQYGQPWDGCPRGRLRRLEAQARAFGIDALIGSELEFVLTAADGSAFPARNWQAYGLGSLFAFEEFAASLEAALRDAGVPIEQIHPEYASHQFEFSIAPSAALPAADRVVLARLVTARVARRYGLLASFSPQPVSGEAGSGAHQHLSLTRAGVPLLSGGNGPHGMTAEGASALAGIVRGLPETLGVFAGSVLSPSRLRPGHWSGAFACWGLENREAAVRFCAATPGNPRGANIELKCVDPSGNPYLTAATALGLALDGVSGQAPLPAEVGQDPALLSAAEIRQAGVVRLPETQAAAIGLLRDSKLAHKILGADILGALLAVRTHEIENYTGLPVEELTERFRFAWSS